VWDKAVAKNKCKAKGWSATKGAMNARLILIWLILQGKYMSLLLSASDASLIRACLLDKLDTQSLTVPSTETGTA
jgi:hypothetical protein